MGPGVQHVVQKGHRCVQFTMPPPVQTERQADLRLFRVPFNRCLARRQLAHWHFPPSAGHAPFVGPLLRTATERAWACRPSDSANRITSSATSANNGGLAAMRLVFLMKSSTLSADANRAAPLVGSTWLGPAK